MTTTQNKPNADLVKFISEFKPDKYKVSPKGVELRSIVDLQGAMRVAKEIIIKCNLKLTVLHTAEMLAMRGFEVNYL